MSPKARNLIARIAVAIVAIPVLVYLFIRGGWFWTLFVEILVILSFWESTKLFRLAERKLPRFLLLELCVIPPLLFHFHLWQWIAPWAFFVIATVAYYNIRRPEPLATESNLSELTVTILYLGLGFGFFIGIRQCGSEIEGARWLMFLFADLWVADTFAMLFGALWGKKKFAPVVSPNKTWVGFWAGLVGGGLVGVVFVFGGWLPTSAWKILVMAIGISWVGQYGDLFESLLKRRAGVKDISAIIPGHGGVLDRFDSALFAAPLLYFFLKVLVYSYI